MNPKVTLVDYTKSPWFNSETREEYEKVIPQRSHVVFCLLASHEEAANNIYIGMEAFKGIIDSPDMLNFMLLKLRVDNYADQEDLSMAKLHDDYV